VVTAALGGTVTANKSVTVSASTDSLLVNAALAIGGGGTRALPQCRTHLFLQSNACLHPYRRARNHYDGRINIYADSQEIVTADAAGAASAHGGRRRTLDIIVTQVITKAYTEASVTRTRTQRRYRKPVTRTG
jgi:hypothetical protein